MTGRLPGEGGTIAGLQSFDIHTHGDRTRSQQAFVLTLLLSAELLCPEKGGNIWFGTGSYRFYALATAENVRGGSTKKRFIEGWEAYMNFSSYAKTFLSVDNYFVKFVTIWQNFELLNFFLVQKELM